MPLPDTPRLGFIGAGRLARCLALRFAAAGFPVVAIASRTAESAAALSARIDGCRAVDTPQQVVDAADLIFLTVPDDHLASTAAALRFDAARAASQALVHCSGASAVELLDPAKRQGA
uniref:NAD(P)-binding domain-containing protein n=2 Tax=Burkholderia TaxID=32008 RepID=UPI00163F51AC